MGIILKRFKPGQIIVMGFIFVIIIGSILLNLPIASNNGESIGIVDAIFTATSAVCVTGLVVVNTFEQWTLFGKTIILLLIQIGGLGFMTVVTLFLILAGKKITLKERIVIQESLNQNSLQGMVKLVKNILLCTIIFELIGAVLLTVVFIIDGYSVLTSMGMGIFHSISAFCNAGFDVIGTAGLTPYANNFLLNIVIMSLIICGGLGYTVWLDILDASKKIRTKNMSYKRALSKLTLHTKIVLWTTLILIVFGWIFFFVCEFNNSLTIKDMSMGEKVLTSLFQSVTCRTAGFNTIDQAGMTYASKFMSIMLMFIGGSPAGTAGGIKTTTLAIIVIAVLSVVRGSNKINFMERNIPFQVLQKALAVFFVSFGSFVIITMILIFTEDAMAANYEFLDLLFETSSAIGTVGLTTGVTPTLSPIGRIMISIGMFLGRLGPITMVIALAKQHSAFSDSLDYPEEKIMVG